MKIIQDTRSYLSTLITIKFASELGKVDSQNLLDAAYAEFFRIGQKYTRFEASSELSSLNRSQEKEFPLDPEFLFLLQKSLEFAEFSGGIFDPTVIDLLELHGYKNSFNPKEILQKQTEIVDIKKYLKTRPSWREVELNTEKSWVKLAAGQRIDLGGIGKGHAIDCAANVLKQQSTSFLIEAGGDIYGFGINTEKNAPWQVNLGVKFNKEDKDEQSLGYYLLNPDGESICSSGSWSRMAGKFHHLLNPNTGLPEDAAIQTFVVAKDAITADALATIIFLGGAEKLDEISTKYHAEGLLLDSAKKIFASDKFVIQNY